MLLQYTPYSIPMAATVVALVVMAVYAWKRPEFDTRLMGILLACAVEWSLGYLFELSSVRLPVKLFWAKMQYPGITLLPIAWLGVALQYTGRIRRVGAVQLAWLLAIPVITVGLVFTNELHRLVYSFWWEDSAGMGARFTTLAVVHGPWFWVSTAYLYCVAAAATVMTIGVLLSSPLHRWQAAVVIVGALLPWSGNALYLAGHCIFPGLDLTPMAFALTGAILCWGLTRFRLLDIIPIARSVIVEEMTDGVIVIDDRGRVADVNPAARGMVGISYRDIASAKMDDLLPTWDDLVGDREHGGVVRSEMEVTKTDGHHYYDIRVTPLDTGQGVPTGQLVVLRDLTDRRRMEQALRRSEEQYRLLFNTMSEGFALHEIICDDEGMPADYRFIEVNGAFERLTGLRREDVIGRTVREVLPDIEPEWFDRYGAVALNGGSDSFELYTRAMGRHFAVSCNSHSPGRFAVIFTDISDRKLAEERLNHLAHYDSLTGLPNRFLFTDRLGQALARARRQHSAAALLFLDLDGFKDINDTLGHGAGDQWLAEVGERLSTCVRACDTVARFGGDEFVLVLSELTNPTADAEAATRRVLSTLAAPFVLDGKELRISASIGITIAPADGETVSDLMKNADMAMYRAKESGRNCYRFFSDDRRCISEAPVQEMPPVGAAPPGS